MSSVHAPSLTLAEPSSWRGELPERAPSLDEARAYCERLARSHYENFHVASFFLPSGLKEHFYPLYAYCRWADDLGDETGDRELSLKLLDLWEAELDACYRGEARHPVFVALASAIKACDIPAEPFHDLLTAFRQDQRKFRYANLAEVYDYCKGSANPVGRLVLYVCGYRDEERQRLSDYTCTALQLANFWQDVVRDYKIGRIYIPLDAMSRHGYTEADLAVSHYNQQFSSMMKELVNTTRELFHKGIPLVGMVEKKLAVDIELFSSGGMEILRMIEQRNYDVLASRPKVSSLGRARLLLSVFARHLFSGSRRRN